MCLSRSERIRPGIRHREIHLRRLGRAEIAVGAGFLHLVEGIAEHLIVRLLAVEQKVDGLSHLLVLNLTVEILVHHLGSLLRCNIGQKIGAQIPRDGDVIRSPGVARRIDEAGNTRLICLHL